MIDLDKKDRKLLYFLSRNCRLSNTQLSKKIGLSKNSIQYRIERMRREKIIQKFSCTINLGALNLNTVTVLFRFNEDIYSENEIIEYFKCHKFADWVVTLSGDYDLFVEFVVKDIRHLEILINEILERFRNVLNYYKLFFSLPIKVEHLLPDYYSDLRLEYQIPHERVTELVAIEEKDRKILVTLSEDSSLPFLQIARKLGMSIDVVRYRIKNLINKGVIQQFFSEVNMKKLGYTEYLFRIKLTNISKDKLYKLRQRLLNNSNITYAFMDITGFNVIFVCKYRDTEGIDHLSRGLRKEFSEIIAAQEYLIVKEQVLFNLYPKGMLKL